MTLWKVHTAYRSSPAAHTRVFCHFDEGIPAGGKAHVIEMNIEQVILSVVTLLAVGYSSFQWTRRDRAHKNECLFKHEFIMYVYYERDYLPFLFQREASVARTQRDNLR